MRANCRRIAYAAALAMLVPRVAGAEDSTPIEDARWAFAEGTSHYEARRYEAALASFSRSQSLVPSPNTLLMAARCERALGRRVDAAQSYERAAEEARRRAATGDARYAQAGDAATAEGKELRAQLATLRVHVETKGASLKVDGQAVVLGPGGETSLWREPGTASIEVLSPRGGRQRQTATLTAGSVVAVSFGGDETSAVVATDGATPTRARSTRAWPLPAAIGSGALALAGLGTFAVFGNASQNAYNELAARCGPSRCGPADRDLADRGASQQTIANVGIAIGVVGAIATVVFTVLALEGGSDAAPK